MSKKTVTIEKHAHYLEVGDRLLGKGGGRARVVTNVARSVGLIVVGFARGARTLHPLDRVRVRVRP